MSESTLLRLRVHLGFSSAEVATAGGWSRKRFAEIEREVDLDIDDGLKLSDLYGVDVARILETEKVTTRDVPIAALLKGSAETLTADARFAISGAMSAARDVRQVQTLLGVVPTVPVTTFGEDRDLRHPESGIATRLAARVRERLGLTGVIPSMVSDVCDPLGVLVFTARFADRAVDALSAWSRDTGPIILVNGDSPVARSPLALRTALAHEICHLLFDREKMRSVRTFCELERTVHSASDAQTEAIERRARAFQVELIGPSDLLLHRWKQLDSTPAARIRDLCEEFGMGPVAVARQIGNAPGGPPFVDPGVMMIPNGPWREVERLQTRETHPTIPVMRRGLLLQLVRLAMEREILSFSRGRELLRLSSPEMEELVATWSS